MLNQQACLTRRRDRARPHKLQEALKQLRAPVNEERACPILRMGKPPGQEGLEVAWGAEPRRVGKGRGLANRSPAQNPP